MALVAYGSSGESDSEDEGPQIVVNGANKNLPKQENPPTTGSVLPEPAIAENFLNGPEKADNKAEFHISDDEDEVTNGIDNILDEKQEPDLLSIISRKLPLAKLKTLESFVDKNEDTSTLIKKVDYGDKLEEPPAKKKKKDGPVKISIPSLKELKTLEEDEDDKPRPLITASKTGSGLFALLPQPQNKTTRRPINTAVPETGESKFREPTDGMKNNLKPTGVRRSGLVPHIIANPVIKDPSDPPGPAKRSPAAASLPASKPKSTPADDSDSEEEDFMGLNSGSYFPEPEVPEKSARGLVNPVPSGSSDYIFGLKKPPPGPIIPSNPSFVPLDVNEVDQEELGPAVAPYPPTQYNTLPDPSLVDNEAAIARLAGKAAKRREFDDMKIIDVHEDQMRGDPNVWLTKAMTEEQAPLPNRKAGPKGLAKTRHQITYLAHQAKERDWELRQEWSQARANKRASMNKYGFC